MCRQTHLPHAMFEHVQSAHIHTHSPREHAWIKGAQPIAPNGVLKRFCHLSIMSHPLQHLSLSTSARSLSLTSPTFQSFSPSQSHSLTQDPYTCTDPRWSGGSTGIPSPHSSRGLKEVAGNEAEGNLQLSLRNVDRKDRVLGSQIHSRERRSRAGKLTY